MHVEAQFLKKISHLFGSVPENDAWARQLPQAVNFQRLGLDRPAWARQGSPGEAAIQTSQHDDEAPAGCRL